MSYTRHPPYSRPSRSNAAKIALFVGALALIAGILVARQQPATTYEVSLYGATPALFWASIAVALGCALGVGVLAPTAILRRTSLVLGGLAMIAIIGLPLIRGYAFYGTADPMSHLGWVRDLVNGRLWLPELLYPGLHGTALFTEALTSASLTRTMMLVPVVYLVLFLIGVPLAIRSITGDWMAILLGTFAGFMFIPINNIAAHLSAHPSTMGILFIPFTLALLLRYLREDAHNPLGISATGVVLGVSLIALIFIHPQQASNLFLLLGAIVVVQEIRRRRGQPTLRRVHAQTILLGAVLMGWSLGHARVVEAVQTLAEALLNPTAGSHIVAQRSGSLLAIGASPFELFLKLFLVGGVFAALTGVVMLAAVRGRLDHRLGADVIGPLSAGLVPVGLLFVLYLVAGGNAIFFRHLGFIMALLTILGTIGLVYLWRGQSPGWPSPARHQYGRPVLIVAVAILMVLSIATVFPSPYMYKPTPHVTEASLEGHGTVFDHAAPEVPFYGIRDGPDRYRDALIGTGRLNSTRFRYARGVSGETLDDGLSTAFGQPSYLVVSQYDRGREIEAFQSLRYTESQLETIGAEPGVHRLMTNGDVKLFLVA